MHCHRESFTNPLVWTNASYFLLAAYTFTHHLFYAFLAYGATAFASTAYHLYPTSTALLMLDKICVAGFLASDMYILFKLCPQSAWIPGALLALAQSWYYLWHRNLREGRYICAHSAWHIMTAAEPFFFLYLFHSTG